MKIFIEGGCFDGKIIKGFCNRNSDEYEIYGFEPNDYHEKWEEIKTEYPKHKINFIQKALWIEDGQIDFDDSKDVGSTIVPTSKNYQRGNETITKCIDFSKWLSQFKKEDYIYLRMDIESSEYKVLDKMINDKTIELIDKLEIEFHDLEPSEDSKKKQDVIEEKFKEIDLNYRVM